MASPSGIDGNADDESHETFPAADADGELHPRKTSDFPLDPISSNVSKSKDHVMERAESGKEEEDKTKEKMKSMFIISGVAVAVIAAIFAITKKLREK